jgi:hypothetical protein
MLRRLAFLVPLAVLAYPGAAAATDYCVAPNTTCGGTNVATLEAALDAADNATNSDRVFLGSATYTASSASGYSYSATSAPVEIIGAGTGSTTLTAPAGASRVLGLDGGAGSVLRDLSIVLPANVPVSARGLDLNDLAQNVSISAHPTQTNQHVGVRIESGGSFVDGSITLSQSIGNVIGAIVGTDASATPLARTGITARTGVSVQQPDVVLERLTLISAAAGAEVARSGVTIRSSLVMPVSGGTGVSTLDQPGIDASLTADGITIVGDGSPGSAGVGASSLFAAPASSTILLRNSIVRDVETSLSRFASDTGSASVTVERSDYDPNATASLGSGPGGFTPAPGMLEPGGNLNVDPLFVDPAADFHLAAGSPLIDAGDPAAAGGLDFDGLPLLADGNGDGLVRRDMGAFERPAPAAPPGGAGPPSVDDRAPVVSGFRAVPRRFGVIRRGARGALRRGTRFRFGLDEAAAVTIGIERGLPGRRVGRSCRKPSARNRAGRRCLRYRRLGALRTAGLPGANALRFTGRLGRRALAAGPYRARILATDMSGNRSAPRTTRFMVLAG